MSQENTTEDTTEDTTPEMDTVGHSTTEAPVDGAPAPAVLTINDLKTMVKVIQVGAKRGTFNAEELEAVGTVYKNLVNFLAESGHITIDPATPNEPTNALVVKHEELPEPLKSQFKKVLESNAGQNSLSLSDAANQFTVADGSKLLQALHKGKYLEKVVTKNVILTPNAKTMLPLDQLNNILDGAGGAKVESYKAPEPVATMQLNPGAPTMPDLNDTGALSDTQVATDLRNQKECYQKQKHYLQHRLRDVDVLLRQLLN